MPAPLLTIDVGNSRSKACLFSGGAPRSLWDVPLPAIESELESALAAALDELPRDTRCALSVVGPRAVEEVLLSSLRARFADVACNPASGLRLDVRSPETVGHDRLYAARGALELLAAAAVVVDAGTALTVDAVRPPVDDRDGAGVFLGGAIAAGPELLAAALALRGARLPEFVPEPGVPALGKGTPEALRAGVAVGFEGAALRLVERVSAEAGLDGAVVVLTGGARAYLSRALAESGREVREVPELVHLGLRAASGA